MRSTSCSVVVAVVAVASLGCLAWPGAARAAVPEGTPVPAPTPILGGDVVEPCGFPTAVSIGGSCTGTLVHPWVVVYAAHCGDEVPWIRFGDRIDDPAAFDVVPERCETHPVGQYGFGTDAAFCVLSAAVDIATTPPLMGCEVEAALQVGQPVTAVGYGTSDDEVEPYGVKRFLDTEITALSWDEVFIGGLDEGVCYGDSGGPTYVRLEDGSWRSFGITSWGQPGCGYGGYLSTIHHNIQWLETASGFDITPCHDGEGNWDPSGGCGGFDLDPHSGGGDWASGCELEPISGYAETCGAAYDPDLVDDEPPTLTIVSPVAYSRIDPPEGAQTATVPVEIATEDPGGRGVGAVELVIEQDGEELARLPDAAKPFGFEGLAFSVGVWTLHVEGSDRAGNEAWSEAVVFAVGVDPPPEPEPEPEPEPSDDSAGPEDPPPEPPEGSSSGAEGTTGDTDGGTGTPLAGDDAGCGCRSGAPSGGAWWLALGLLALRRRRAVLGAALLVAAGCGDDLPSTLDGSSTTSGTSGSGPADQSTSTSSPGETTAGPVDTGSSDDAPIVGCGNGLVEDDERCDDGNLIDGDGCSAACEPSGELLEELELPDRGVDTYATAVAIAGDGTIVVAGWRELAEGGAAAMLLGLTPELGVAWSTEVPGATPEHFVRPDGLAIADDGAIWVAGRSLLAQKGPNIDEPWIARFAQDGTLEHAQALAGPNGLYFEVAALPGGDAVAVGWEMQPDESLRALVRRHAAGDGSEVWVRIEPIDEPESAALSVTATAAGELVVAGWTTGFMEYRDLRLATYDEDGNQTGTTTFGEPLTSYYARALVVDDSGDVIVCGSVVRASAGNAVLGRFTLGAASPAVWLQRIEAVGPGSTSCEGIALDPEGRVAFTGSAFYGDTSFDPIVGRLANDGEILWSGSLPANEGFQADFAEGLALEASGDLIVVGGTESGVNDVRLWVGRVRG